MTTVKELELHSGLEFLDYQVDALNSAATLSGPSQRLCLYYKTGAGKTYTALACLRLWGAEDAVVVAPPATHAAWEGAGDRLGVQLHCMSHAKFRMKGTALSRSVAVIADEMHLFGGHAGQGWKKLEGLARGLKAPLVLASATPNYNDAERVYCIQRILDPASCRGGYLEFIYKNCTTEQNHFGLMPIVTGFIRFGDAAAYLAALPGVEYLPDDLVYKINDISVYTPLPYELNAFGYNARKHRIIASQIEERHTRTYQTLVDEDNLIRSDVYDILTDLAGQASTPMLVYANHSTIADALGRSLEAHGVSFEVVTGSTSKKLKEERIARFKSGELDVLVGTASLATGTDGLDKVCDWLVILDDTDDASLRRQLVGRIMPRGRDTDATKKQVYRLLQ